MKLINLLVFIRFFSIKIGKISNNVLTFVEYVGDTKNTKKETEKKRKNKKTERLNLVSNENRERDPF